MKPLSQGPFSIKFDSSLSSADHRRVTGLIRRWRAHPRLFRDPSYCTYSPRRFRVKHEVRTDQFLAIALAALLELVYLAFLFYFFFTMDIKKGLRFQCSHAMWLCGSETHTVLLLPWLRFAAGLSVGMSTRCLSRGPAVMFNGARWLGLGVA